MESLVATIFIALPILDMRTWDLGRQEVVKVWFTWPGLQEEGRGHLGLLRKGCAEGQALDKRAGLVLRSPHGVGEQAALLFLLAFLVFEEGLSEVKLSILSYRWVQGCKRC